VAWHRRRRACIDCFNNRRLLVPIGYVPPPEFEQADFGLQDSAVMSAALN